MLSSVQGLDNCPMESVLASLASGPETAYSTPQQATEALTFDHWKKLALNSSDTLDCLLLNSQHRYSELRADKHVKVTNKGGLN
jgi:hypothetical protein